MFTCDTSIPDKGIGQYVQAFLRDPKWFRRRVETVSFLDYDTIRRRVTLDIDMAELIKFVGDFPLVPGRPLVPLAVLKKDLLANFDLRNAAGHALAVAPREADSFFMFSFLCCEAGRVLKLEPVDVPEPIREHLRAIVSDFPDEGDELFQPQVKRWERHESWSDAVTRTWDALLSDENFQSFLRDFTFNYILLAQLPDSHAVQIVKYSYQQKPGMNRATMAESLGYSTPEWEIAAPSIGWGRSYHFQIQPPVELSITGLYLTRRERNYEITVSDDEYDVQVGSGFAQIHTTNAIAQANFRIILLMRVAISGALRSLWLSTVLTAAILLTTCINLHRLVETANTRAEAAVALLLVAPSLVTAYLVRPGEHAIASDLMRPHRYIASISGLLTYLAAGAYVLGEKYGDLHDLWDWVTAIAMFNAAVFTVSIFKTLADLEQADKTRGRTIRDFVQNVPIAPKPLPPVI